MNATKINDLILYHDVPNLGLGIAENVVAIIAHYAALASLSQLPPITLHGPEFGRPWTEIATVTGCSGNSGPSDEELRNGGEMYTCLFLEIGHSPRPSFQPTTIEGTIAHEIVHLRWPGLSHGPEFEARVVALVRGAKFPKPRPGRWSQSTERVIVQARKESWEWTSAAIGLATPGS